MTIPEREQFFTYAQDHPRVPLAKEVLADLVTPIAILRQLARRSTRYFLLESVEGGERWGRYSFLGFDPIVRAYCDSGVVTILDYQTTDSKSAAADSERQATRTRTVHTDKPFEALRHLLMDYRAPVVEELPIFAGGLVGYSAYAMYEYSEPSVHIGRGGAHDFDWMLFDKVIAYDHLKQKMVLIVNADTASRTPDQAYMAARQQLGELESFVFGSSTGMEPTPIEPVIDKSSTSFVSAQTFSEYEEMIERAKRHILNGEIFQVVLSRRFTKTRRINMVDAYRVLRSTNPSPYMVYLRIEDDTIISTSPETLVKLRHGRLTTVPVAGSRPRGGSPAEDRELEADLLADEKELAEHNMLVDLGRNDLGRIARPGSVEVTAYKEIHRYSKVMHICSQVEAELAEGRDAFDALEAVQPAGTLSGAPKIRACQIIEELENRPRGIYGGALGYISLSGQLDCCIAIRMAHQRGTEISVQAGAGIVLDSRPATEFAETEQKAAAVIAAIEAVEGKDDDYID